MAFLGVELVPAKEGNDQVFVSSPNMQDMCGQHGWAWELELCLEKLHCPLAL